MLSRNLTRVSNRALKTSTNSQRAYSSFDREFDRLTSLMTRDFGRSFYRRQSPWDFFTPNRSFFYEPVVYYNQPVHSTYEEKTITSDETGRVVVKTQRKVPGKPWETYVEEYVNDKKLEENKKPEAIGQNTEANHTKTAQNETAEQQQEQTTKQSTPESNKTAQSETTSPTEKKVNDQTISTQSNNPVSTVNTFSLFDQHFRQLSDSLMRDFDDFFNVRHPFNNTSRWFEPEVDMLDTQHIDDNATYHAKTVVNDNGRVTVKTVTKNPGSVWETTVKHYGKDGALEEGQQKTEALGDNSKNDQKTGENVESAADVKEKSSASEAGSQ